MDLSGSQMREVRAVKMSITSQKIHLFFSYIWYTYLTQLLTGLVIGDVCFQFYLHVGLNRSSFVTLVPANHKVTSP